MKTQSAQVLEALGGVDEMAMPTRKEFTEFAKVLKTFKVKLGRELHAEMVKAVGDMLAKMNPRFNHEIFAKAAGVGAQDQDTGGED